MSMVVIQEVFVLLWQSKMTGMSNNLDSFPPRHHGYPRSNDPTSLSHFSLSFLTISATPSAYIASHFTSCQFLTFYVLSLWVGTLCIGLWLLPSMLPPKLKGSDGVGTWKTDIAIPDKKITVYIKTAAAQSWIQIFIWWKDNTSIHKEVWTHLLNDFFHS